MDRTTIAPWLFWALLSAAFAALTAVFAKIGVKDIDSDYATFLRTIVILGVTAALLAGSGKLRSPMSLPPRAVLFLVLSGLATGASWLCYFRALKLGDAARVAPVDKLSVVMVAIFGAVFLQEELSTVNWLGVILIAAGVIMVAIRT